MYSTEYSSRRPLGPSPVTLAPCSPNGIISHFPCPPIVQQEKGKKYQLEKSPLTWNRSNMHQSLFKIVASDPLALHGPTDSLHCCVRYTLEILYRSLQGTVLLRPSPIAFGMPMDSSLVGLDRKPAALESAIFDHRAGSPPAGSLSMAL